MSAGLAKVFAIRESVHLRFESTFTNVLNHTNFTPPNNNNQQLYSAPVVPLPSPPITVAPLSTAGVLTSPTATSSRQLQFAVKVIF